jgi:hypothetical protein
VNFPVFVRTGVNWYELPDTERSAKRRRLRFERAFLRRDIFSAIRFLANDAARW